MWDCLLCKAKSIAADLGFCPHCDEPKQVTPASSVLAGSGSQGDGEDSASNSAEAEDESSPPEPASAQKTKTSRER
jgi:hypothetical protein